MSGPQQHAPGVHTISVDHHRGLCWCEWRGTDHDGVMSYALARWDAHCHVAGALS